MAGLICAIGQILQGDMPQIVAASSLTWKFLCSFIAYVAVDRLGRRLLFVVSGTRMCLCMVVLAVTNSLLVQPGGFDHLRGCNLCIQPLLPDWIPGRQLPLLC